MPSKAASGTLNCSRTYADVARFSGGYLVLRRRPIITALAREAAVARHVQLIKQE